MKPMKMIHGRWLCAKAYCKTVWIIWQNIKANERCVCVSCPLCVSISGPYGHNISTLLKIFKRFLFIGLE